MSEFVSIIIKTLNEEKNIAVAIESSLAALADIPGEVIVADSCSTDRTVEIAGQYPVTVVRLGNAQEKCCGIGPQLGYQHSRGTLVYILDGDMKMRPGFIRVAVDFLALHPEVVGVAGRVMEMNTTSLEYIARTERGSQHMAAGAVDRLDMGGLYRRSAVERAGYFSDRNLHSYEELDLAVRLRAQGGVLWRLDEVSVEHWGHDTPPYRLLMKRWRSGYICGIGELARAGMAVGNFALLIRAAKEMRIYLAVLAWWALLVLGVLLSGVSSALLVTALALLPLMVLLMAARKRSWQKAVFSVVSWNFNAAGFLRGFLRPRSPAGARIHSEVLSTPS